IEPQLYAGVGHVVPVDRQPGPAEIGRAGQSDPLAARQAAEFPAPVRPTHDRLDALPEADRADPQVVGGQRTGRDEVPEAQLRGVDRELLGDLVEMDLEGEARLRRAVAAFRPAGRLV